MIYLQLIAVFLKIGAVVFGGGYAMIPLIEEAVVGNNWCTPSEFADIATIAQLTPGPLGLNTATYAGKVAAGFWGGLVASGALVLPGLIITSLIFYFLTKHLERSRHLQSFVRGLRSAAMGLIFIAVLFFAENSVFNQQLPFTDFSGWGELRCSVPAGLIFLAAFFTALKTKLSPIVILLLAAVLGVLFL